MTEQEVLDRLKAGDVPSQKFHARMPMKNFSFNVHYKFADATVASASLISRMVSRRLVRLIVDGDTRRVEINDDDEK